MFHPSRKFKKWSGRIALIATSVGMTISVMLLALQVQAMFTPEAQKTMDELYDLKKANSVTLRSLNTVKMRKELELAKIDSQLALIREINLRADICIDKLQQGSEETCDIEKLEANNSHSSAPPQADNQDFQ